MGKEHAQFPTVLHYTTARKIRTESGKTKIFVRFSSNKSLSTTYFFLMVIKNTLLVSKRHSLDWNNTALLAKLPHRIRCIYLQLSILRRDNFELFQFKLNV